MRRRRISFGIAGLMVLGIALAGLHRGLATPLPQRADRSASAVPVDVELVLGVDVSYSMDPEEQELQREGYRLAITSEEFLSALREGMHGKIAITYFEWAGNFDHRVIVPWRLIDGLASAQAVADEIGRSSYRRAARTSISGALEFAQPLFDSSGYRGVRRVIDISGDGANNQGSPVAPARDKVVAAGITINGLPIMLKRPRFSMMDIDNLDVYYEDCVTGGPGTFVIPIKQRSEFRQAIHRKLVQEIASLVPQPKLVPASSEKPRVDCMIGEKLWQQRWGD